MRISNSTMGSSLLEGLEQILKRLNSCQTQVATTKRINKPSDDPAATAEVLRINSNLRANKQYLRNIQRAEGWLGVTENVLDQISSLLSGLRALAVQGASDTLGADDRQALAHQVNQDLETLFGHSNTTFGGKYIFAGTRTRTAPYTATRDASGQITAVSASGENSGKILHQIGKTERLQVNVTGTELFESGIFATVIQLRDGLQANDTQAVGRAIEELDRHLNTVAELTSSVGAKVKRLQLAENRAQDDSLVLTDMLSRAEDVDIVKAVSELQREQAVYRAALAATAQIIQPTLMDFLR
ncbi:MAG: flagellar hook-associated protein 3 [Candidatus Latescibacterota bacterium]|nr:MAG: flagellar hook-associated protein 3 [Candidatus Latescibacterota bacterium]RKY72383.1 MAG: flagellar hook-associated protein 3 [Candidatus Latescibacterota bacterium]